MMMMTSSSGSPTVVWLFAGNRGRGSRYRSAVNFSSQSPGIMLPFLPRVSMSLCIAAMCLSASVGAGTVSYSSEGEPGEYMESVPRKKGLTYKLAVRRWSTSTKPAHATVILQVVFSSTLRTLYAFRFHPRAASFWSPLSRLFELG